MTASLSVLRQLSGEVALSATLSADDIRDAFRRDQRIQRINAINTNDSTFCGCYIDQVLTDSTVIVMSEDGGRYKIPFDVADDGSVTFGDKTPVRIEYVESAGLPDIPQIQQPPMPMSGMEMSASLTNLIRHSSGAE